MSGSLAVAGHINCASLTQTSDRRIKTNIVDADLDSIQELFDSIQVKQYERTDIPGPRIGFIADDIQDAVPEEFGNIVYNHYTEEEGNMLALDYARLGSTILWGMCKNLQARVEALENSLGERNASSSSA